MTLVANTWSEDYYWFYEVTQLKMCCYGCQLQKFMNSVTDGMRDLPMVPIVNFFLHNDNNYHRQDQYTLEEVLKGYIISKES